MATILVVDTDAEHRERFRGFLEQQGHLVVAIASGRDAVPIIETLELDVVFSETYMEEFDGIELLLSTRKCRPDLPIVLLADPAKKSYQPVAAIAHYLGAAGQLSKPVDSESVGRLLLRVLAA